GPRRASAGTAVAHPPWVRRSWSNYSAAQANARAHSTYRRIIKRSRNHHRAFACRHLVVDPAVGLLETFSQADRRLPPEQLEDTRVVRIPPAHTLRGVQLVFPLQFEARDLLDDGDELVDGDELGAAEIDRLDDVGIGERLGPMNAVVYVHERPGLLTIAPDLDPVVAGELGRSHFAADRRRRLFAPAVVGAVGAIHIVIPGHPGVQAEVLPEVTAHALAEQLFPAVAVLRHGGVCILLPQCGDVGVSLVLRRVHARR